MTGNVEIPLWAYKAYPGPPVMFAEYREGGRLDIWCQLLRLVEAARISERFGWPLRELNWWKV